MNDDIAISVRGLGKRYRIGRAVQKPASRLALARRLIGAPFEYLRYRLSRPTEIDSIWAMRGISFDVKRGEVLGIIGRNGAGKSTLLKILSRITCPTEGHARIIGRVNSLLEVGVGFHPELTGRENVFLNAALHGLRHAEIETRFDQIVEFAGVRKFIDTPVKRYSSGMNVRLGFAVAAHLDPDVLIVDEVLSVGDVGFQRKCVSRIEEVAGLGRTVLFVSHQMEAVSALCHRCLLLDQGRIVADGSPSDVIRTYINAGAPSRKEALRERKDRKGAGRFRFVDTWVENEAGNRAQSVRTGEQAKIVVVYESHAGAVLKNLRVAFAINTIRNVAVTDLCNTIAGQDFGDSVPASGRIECSLPRVPLNRGRYTYNVYASSFSGDLEDHVENAGEFDVEAGDYFGSGRLPDERRLIVMDQDWQVHAEKSISDTNY